MLVYVPHGQLIVIEHPSSIDNLNKMESRIIVDTEHFVKEMRKVANHHYKCPYGGNMAFISQIKNGLFIFRFKCTVCIEVIKVTNVDTSNNKLALNQAALMSALATGHTFSLHEEALSILGLRTISTKSWRKEHQKVCEMWEKCLADTFTEAGQEERKLAMDAGDADPDNVPFITVICDGSWAHRSFGHKYTSNSGCAVIIGARTQKILFLGFRSFVLCVLEMI